MSTKFAKFWADTKEYFRKKLVYLKRNPQIISLILIVITCFIFTFKLSLHSSALMKSDDYEISIVTFGITLASFMSIISFFGVKKLTIDGKKISKQIIYTEDGNEQEVSSYVEKKVLNKKVILPIIITVGLLVIQFILDLVYLKLMNVAIAKMSANNELVPIIVYESVKWMKTHLIALSVSLFSIFIMPVTNILLNLIDTNVKDSVLYEESEQIKIELAQDDEINTIKNI